MENLTTNLIFKTDPTARAAKHITKLRELLSQMDEIDDSNAPDFDMYDQWFREHFGDKS